MIQTSFWVDEEITEISRTAVRLLGMAGRKLHVSNKGMNRPTTIFNANIFNRSGTRIWFGDLDIERGKEVLLKLSGWLGTLYVLYEGDGSFLQKKPSSDIMKDSAPVIIEGGKILYYRDLAESLCILEGGRCPA